MIKLSAEQSKQASVILGRLDKIAQEVQENFESWGMPFDDAKTLVHGIDSVADDFEKMAYGPESFIKRQREVLGKVLQRDPNETYMDSFNGGDIIQVDADEPYMQAYADDESEGVSVGRDRAGKPLSP